MQRLHKEIPTVQLAVTAAAIYTAPVGVTATINNLSLTNTSAAPVAVTLYRLGSAGTPSAANSIMSAFALAAGQSYVPPQVIGLALESGSRLFAMAATAAVVTVAGGVYETSGSPS